METKEQIFMEINEQIFMEINEQIVRDVTFSLNLDDYIYNQALKEFHIQRLRNKMGEDRGIHLGFPKQDPLFQLDPNM